MSLSCIRTQLLKSSFAHAKTLGFNEHCIVKACEEQKLPSTTAGLIQPVDVAYHAMDTWHDRMEDALLNGEDIDLNKMGVTDRIRHGLWLRLSYLQETQYLQVWPQAMALGLVPTNLPITLSKLNQIGDTIWFVAGDNSVDFNWYSKRALLAMVYISTELYMIQDP